ncbi:MAG: SRPBCC family protein [Planctomycetes bacterium]|nr:SRPBCC family protein [Planctomycetota bacterium]
MLKIEGSVEVAATLEDAWALFNRFGEVARLIPSVENVEVDGEAVDAQVAVRLGKFPVRSRVRLEVVERKPLACLKARGASYLGQTIRERASKAVRGIDDGSVGRLFLHLDLRPTDTAGRILLLYSAEVEAEGRLRRIYQSILALKAPAMMAEFAENIRQVLEGKGAKGP